MGILAFAFVMGVPAQVVAGPNRVEKVQIQSRAELLYRAAAEGRWNDAYELFLPQERRSTPVERFIILFSNNRPFKCRAVRIRHVEDESYLEMPELAEASVEVSMRLKVEHPDGRVETIRKYSDVWIKSQGVWYFAANRRGPYG